LRLLGENLVAYWSMDEFPSGFGSTDNTVYDLTSLNNNGTANGGPTINSGKWDNALSFDGTDDEIRAAGDFMTPGEAKTICAWIYDRALNAEARIVAPGYAEIKIMVGNNTADDLEVGTYDGAWHYNSYDHSTNIWYFVAGVADGNGTQEMFVNGASQGTATYDETAISDELEAVVNGGNGFDGLVDEVCYFNKALSENEIQRIYERTKPDNLADGDLKTGTWISKWHDFGENIYSYDFDTSASVSSGENAYVNLESSSDGSTVSDNTGWISLSDGSNSLGDNSKSLENLRYRRIEYKFETENTVHSPSISDFTFSYALMEPPAVLTSNIDNLDNEACDIMGELTDMRGWPKVERWFQKRKAGGTWENVAYENVSSIENFAYSYTGLAENTQYEFRAVAEDNYGENVASIMTFTTTLVDTLPAQDVTNDSAELTAKIAYGKKEGSRVYDNADLRFDLRPQGRTNWTHTGTQNVTGNEVPLQPAWALHADQTYEYRSHVVQFYSGGFETLGGIDSFKTETTSAQVPPQPPVTINLSASWFKTGEKLKLLVDLENQDGGPITGLPTPDNLNFDLWNPQGNRIIDNGLLPERTAMGEGVYENRSAYEFSSSDNTGVYSAVVWANYKGSEDWETRTIEFKKWMQEALENVSAVKENRAKEVRIDTSVESVSWKGAVADFWATVTDQQGRPVTVDNVELKVYDPSNTITADVLMNSKGDGFWFENLDTSDWKEGHYEVVTKAMKGGRSYWSRRSWRLSSGPFDIAVTDVQTNTGGSDVLADFEVRNMGHITKDVYFKWRIEGPTGTVHEESETHALDPGESWTPSKSFTGELAGGKVHKVVGQIWWGPPGSSPDQMYEHARASKSFLYEGAGGTTPILPPPPPKMSYSVAVGPRGGPFTRVRPEKLPSPTPLGEDAVFKISTASEGEPVEASVTVQVYDPLDKQWRGAPISKVGHGTYRAVFDTSELDTTGDYQYRVAVSSSDYKDPQPFQGTFSVSEPIKPKPWWREHILVLISVAIAFVLILIATVRRW